jgi:hypothetical protein
MNKNYSIILLVLACATRALADSTIGSVTVGAQSPVTVMAGSNAVYTITVGRAGTGNLDAYLSATNLPGGVSATFVPSFIHFSGSLSTRTGSLTLAIAPNVAPGTYNFTVVARDGGSPNLKSATGSLVIGSGSNIGLGLPSTLAIQKDSQGQTQITCTGPVGRSYQIQATSDLANPSWAPIGTVTTDQFGVCIFVDGNASLYSQRFYRTESLN